MPGESDDLLVVKRSGEITGAMELYGMRGAPEGEPVPPAGGGKGGHGEPLPLHPHVHLHVGSPMRIPPPLASPRTVVPVTVEDLPPPTALGSWAAGGTGGNLSPRAQVQAAAASPMPRMSGSGGHGGNGGSGGSGGSGGTLRLPMMQAVLTGCVETIQKTAAEQLRAQEVGMLDQEEVAEEMIDAGPGVGAAAVPEIEPLKEPASEGLRQEVHVGLVGQGEAVEGAGGQRGLTAGQRSVLLAVEAEAVAAGDALVSAGLAAAPEAEVMEEGVVGAGGAPGEGTFGMDEGQLRALKAAAMEGAQRYMAMGMREQEEVEDRVEGRGDGAGAGAGGERQEEATAAELPGSAVRSAGVAEPEVAGQEPVESEVPAAMAVEGSSAAGTPADIAAATLQELMGSEIAPAAAPEGGFAAVTLVDTATTTPGVVATVAAAVVPVAAAALDTAAQPASGDTATSGAAPSVAPTAPAAPGSDTPLGPTSKARSATSDTAAIAPIGSPSSSPTPQPQMPTISSPGAAPSSLLPSVASAPGTPAAKVPVTITRYAANASSAPLPLAHTASGASATVASLAAALAAAMARATAAASASASAHGWQPAPGSGSNTLPNAADADADPVSSMLLSGILFSSTKPPTGDVGFGRTGEATAVSPQAAAVGRSRSGGSSRSPARAVPVSVTHDTSPIFADAPGSPNSAAASPPKSESATSALPTLGKYGKRGSRRRRLAAAARAAPAIHLDAIPEISEQGDSVEALEEEHEYGALLLDRGGSNTSYGSAGSEVSGAGEGYEDEGGEEGGEEVVAGPASGERPREDECALQAGVDPGDAGVSLVWGGGSAVSDGRARVGSAVGDLVPAVDATTQNGKRAGAAGGAAGVLAGTAAPALTDAATGPVPCASGSGAQDGQMAAVGRGAPASSAYTPTDATVGEVEQPGVAGSARSGAGAGAGAGLAYKGASRSTDLHGLAPEAPRCLWVPALGHKRAQATREAERGAGVVTAAAEALPGAASRSMGGGRGTGADGSSASSGGGGAQPGRWGLLGWPVRVVGSGVRVLGGTVAAAADDWLQGGC